MPCVTRRTSDRGAQRSSCPPERAVIANSPVDLPHHQTYTQKGTLSGRFAHFFVVMSMGVEWDRLRRLIQDIVEGQGYELVDVEFKGAGKNSILRIFIDEPAGISHRDCELVSEQVGTVLDVEDLIPFSYTLEVSSPGLERKLVKESDYTRFGGKLARIQTRIPLRQQKVFRGRLQGLHEGKVQLELPRGDLLEIPLDVIDEARLEFDWAAERQRGGTDGLKEEES
jgi:ribosome maturation factor RimP